MRGCFTLFLGIVVGAIALALVQVFLSTPGPLAAPLTGSADVEILLRNQFLTQELQGALKQSSISLPLTGVTVQGEPGQQLIVAASLAAGRATTGIPIRVTLRPVLDQNKLSIQVVQSQLGTLKLPGTLFSSLAAPINQEINRSLADRPYRIVGISTTVEGLLVEVAVPP